MPNNVIYNLFKGNTHVATLCASSEEEALEYYQEGITNNVPSGILNESGVPNVNIPVKIIHVTHSA
jgi:hypothetical protein